jgi:hypothetical protein
LKCWKLMHLKMPLLLRKIISSQDKILPLCIKCPCLYKKKKMEKKNLKWTYLLWQNILIEVNYHLICGFFKDFALWLTQVYVRY